MRKCYSWVWIKHAIRVRRNRNYIWYCYTANLNLHSLKVAKVDLFPLLFRLSSRFHCMGYSSRRLWIKKKKEKVIELLSRYCIEIENGWHDCSCSVKSFFFSFSNDEIITMRCYRIAFSIHPWNHRCIRWTSLVKLIIRFVVKILFWIPRRLSRATVSQSENLNKWYLVFI